jgi:hypothetical protein
MTPKTAADSDGNPAALTADGDTLTTPGQDVASRLNSGVQLVRRADLTGWTRIFALLLANRVGRGLCGGPMDPFTAQCADHG